MDHLKACIMVLLSRLRLLSVPSLLIVVLLILAPLQDARPVSVQAEYQFVWQLFLHGYLERSQLEAEQGYRRRQVSNPESASKFQLLEAEAMVWRGMNEDALHTLSTSPPNFSNPDRAIRKLTIESVAFTHLQKFAEANQRLTEAEGLCTRDHYEACGGVLRARGVLAMRQGQSTAAKQFYLESLSFARTHHDQLLETTVLSYIGVIYLQNEHFDEAIDWSRAAYKVAAEIRAEDMAQVASGNLGWAYFKLGDTEKSLQMFLEAEKRAAELGDVRAEINWIMTAGYVYQDIGELQRATHSYYQALHLAQQINNEEDIVTSSELIAYALAEEGKVDEASHFIDQVTPKVRASGNRLDALDVMLASGKIAVARHNDEQAKEIFHAVDQDPESQTSMRLASEHELARLYEIEGKPNAASKMYRAALATFESARAELRSEDSKLPFLANATPIYDDYIQFLVNHGKVEEALLAADQSRARTLAQGLGLAGPKQALQTASLSARAVARETGATLLFYWLGAQRSYLWAVTPNCIALFSLPKERQISALLERYRAMLLAPADTVEFTNPDGLALYELLIAPASKLISPRAPVMILTDGELSRLNFESLLVPGPGPIPEPGQTAHYWIDDATLLSAPSLAMLAEAKPVRKLERSLLMFGNPISSNPDFPTLPFFGYEMAQISRHFTSSHQAIFAGQQASPGAYLSSDPARYTYIHFVAHAVASQTEPLDSAIILSDSLTGEGSYKLYARDIMQHPIHAQLVTISACYGSGTRTYAGEGLVGLSWAFLRAGALSTIGALWEVSDESTPRLMDTLYQGLEEGQSPETALRRAKLNLLHSNGRFSNPFYWAPFQLYTRQ